MVSEQGMFIFHLSFSFKKSLHFWRRCILSGYMKEQVQSGSEGITDKCTHILLLHISLNVFHCSD